MRSHSSRRRGHRALFVLAAAAGGVGLLPSTDALGAVSTFDNGGLDLFWSNNANWNPDAAVAGNDAKFNSATATTSASTVTSVVDANTSVLSLGYNQFGATSAGVLYHVTQINDGMTLSITGSTGANGVAMFAGSGVDAGGGTDTSYTYIQNQPGAVIGGTFEIQNAAADLIVRNTSATNNVHRSTLDISKLSNFNANMRDIRVGAGDAASDRANGTLYLAFNNDINANSITVGNNAGNGSTSNPAGRLYLGNSNLIKTNSILIGGRSTGNSSAGFTPGITNGSLTIRGFNGIGRADLSIGTQPLGDTSPATSTTNNVMDLTGPSGFGSGSIDAQINALAIGRASAAVTTLRQGVGTLTYNAGIINANDVLLGDDNGTTTNSTATGTINVRANAQMVVNNSLVLTKRTGTGTASGYTGVINIDGTGAGATPAKLRAGTTITDAGGVSTLSVSNGGTLQARGLGTSASRIDNLTLNSGTVVVDIGNSVPVTNWGWVGTLTANGANTIGLQFSGALTTGTFPGISYTALGGAGFGSFTMAKQPARVTAHLVDNLNSIDISIDSADTPKWVGALSDTTVNGTWDVTTTNNWKLVSAGTFTNYQEDLVTYSTTDSVLFDDSATGTTNVDVSTTVMPNAITVNNTAQPYTFGGAGKISGATGITKTGTNTLTISNTGGNDFTGALLIEGGTVNTGADNVLPNAGAITAATGGTFDLQSHTEAVGTVNVSGGTVTAGSGALSADIINANAGTLTAGTGSITAGLINVAGGNATGGAGAINANGLTISAGGTVSGAFNVANSVVAQQGTINANIAGAATLTKNTAGTTLTINSANTYTGVTTLNEGTLAVTHADALGSAAARTVISGPSATTTGVLSLSGGIVVPEPLELGGRRGTSSVSPNFNPHVVNASGDNTLSGNVNLVTNGTLYTIQSNAGKLTVSGNISTAILTTGNNRELFLRGAGNGEVSGGVLNPAGTDPIVLTKRDAGTWTLSGASTYTGGTVVAEGTLVAANGDALGTGALTVNNATARAQAGLTKALSVANVTTTGTGQLDMTNNDMVVKSSTLAAIQSQIVSGFAAGSWNGVGINSSTAAADSQFVTALGYADNSLLALGTFSGVTLTGPEILVKYTYYGDADLSGVTDTDDFTLFLNGFQDPGTFPATWLFGDFDYSGVVDTDDFAVFLHGFQDQGGPLSALSEAVAEASGLSSSDRAFMQAAIAAVPEPTTLGVLGIAGLGLLGRRRRNVRPSLV